MKFKVLSILSFSALLLTIQSCQKKQTDLSDSAAENEVLSAFAERSVQTDIDAVTLQRSAATNPCNGQAVLPDCATISESGDDYPITITIDYGDGCEDENGRVKAGQIVITITDDMLNQGAIRTATLVNFSVNNIAVAGTRTTVNLGEDEFGSPHFSRECDMSMTKNNNVLSRSFSGIATWLEGYDTPECGDNVFELTGAGSCTRPNGTQVTRTIVEPLIIDKTCGYTTQGVVEMDAPMGTRSIDFGDGSCDNSATVRGPNGTHTIQLNP